MVAQVLKINMSKPKVAVIYLSYFGAASEKDIGLCFASLEKVDYPLDKWKLIIVENPSPHGASIPFIERDWLPKAGKTLPEIEIIPNTKDGGYAGANVVGAEAAEAWGADYVYLLNQDATVDGGFLSKAIEYAEKYPKAAVIQSRIMLRQDPFRLNTIGNAVTFLGFGFCIGEGQTLEEAKNNKLPVFAASGAGVLVGVKALNQIGGLFDPDYYLYHEDTDLSWRARLAGFDVAVANDSVIYHHYEFSRSVSKFYWMERNRHLMNLSNYKIATILCLLPIVIPVELGMFALNAKSGWGKEKWRSWVQFLKPQMWQWVVRRHKLVNSFRKIKDQEVLSLMVPEITSRIDQVNHPLVTYVANPILRVYFVLLKFVVRW